LCPWHDRWQPQCIRKLPCGPITPRPSAPLTFCRVPVSILVRKGHGVPATGAHVGYPRVKRNPRVACALPGSVVGHHGTSVKTVRDGVIDRVHVGAEEYELPAVTVFFPAYHFDYLVPPELPAGVLLAVCYDHEHYSGWLIRVLETRHLLLKIIYAAPHGVEQRCATSRHVGLTSELWHAG
ncbi:MAG: hypothetical protein QGI34_05695, partial [Candidatus Latescibacteria bacterium]|nr:hypothetical protein [Candidatus Latescibacterota bacterium]